MKKCNEIDIERINCWVVNLKPFGSETGNEEIREFQEKCVREKIFGMGWRLEEFDADRENMDVFLKKKEEILKNEDKNESDIKREYNRIKYAANNMKRIKENDLVVMRLRNAHYYIGLVSGETYYIKENKILSWVCNIEEWVEFENDEDFPAEIAGRLSARRQPTISIVKNERQKSLVTMAFNSKSMHKIENVSRIKISVDNFARVLRAIELEDLVCAYIYNNICDKYILLPSSCKTSRPLYEFMFVCSHDKPITCQVKNAAVIDVEKYVDNSYKEIYLFSDKGYLNGHVKRDNVKIIDKKELFDFFVDESTYMHDKLSKYYEF